MSKLQDAKRQAEDAIAYGREMRDANIARDGVQRVIDRYQASLRSSKEHAGDDSDIREALRYLYDLHRSL